MRFDGEREQVLDIGERVGLLLRGQRALRPVVFLAALAELDAELVAHQRLQPELGVTEQARGDRRIEHRAKREPEVATHRRDIVVTAVHDLEDRGIGHDRGERREIAKRERIDQAGPTAERGELDQADLLRVVMQAVALGIDADRTARRQLVGERTSSSPVRIHRTGV